MKFDALMHVLLALTVIIVTARALGVLFARLQQPPVIGEVVAGILLGPSLLGRISPEVSNYLLPRDRLGWRESASLGVLMKHTGSHGADRC